MKKVRDAIENFLRGYRQLAAPFRPAALAAQRATTTVPIVFSFGPDPVGDKLVESLARPG